MGIPGDDAVRGKVVERPPNVRDGHPGPIRERSRGMADRGSIDEDFDERTPRLRHAIEGHLRDKVADLLARYLDQPESPHKLGEDGLEPPGELGFGNAGASGEASPISGASTRFNRFGHTGTSRFIEGCADSLG